jgi:hypothetical protein
MTKIKVRTETRWFVLALLVGFCLFSIAGCSSGDGAADEESRQKMYEQALLLHDVGFIERQIDAGRFGTRKDLVTQMEQFVNQPQNVVIDKVTREKKVFKFFKPEGSLLSGEEMISHDQKDGGSRRRNFYAWIVSSPIQAALGIDLVVAQNEFRRKWLQEHSAD